MTSANILDLPSAVSEAPIQEGDAVLIIKPGGNIVPMTFGVDQAAAEAIRVKPLERLNEKELDIALQGQTLFLLSMAAQSEVIMDFLAKVASLPGETDLSKLSRAATAH